MQSDTKTYEIIEGTRAPGARSIKCLLCGLTSHNPNDVRYLYCGNCNIFHADSTRCPRCKSELQTNGLMAWCVNAHIFDVIKEPKRYRQM